MDRVIKVPKGAIFEFTGEWQPTTSRSGVHYLALQLQGGAVIICRDDDSHRTNTLASGANSEGAKVVQVTGDDAYLDGSKLFGKYTVKRRTAAEEYLKRMALSGAKQVMLKLLIDGHPSVKQDEHTFRLRDGKVYVNNRGKGKSLTEITMSWIQEKLNS